MLDTATRCHRAHSPSPSRSLRKQRYRARRRALRRAGSTAARPPTRAWRSRRSMSWKLRRTAASASLSTWSCRSLRRLLDRARGAPSR
eukprot:670569-Prymnesium_polylepis.1